MHISWYSRYFYYSRIVLHFSLLTGLHTVLCRINNLHNILSRLRSGQSMRIYHGPFIGIVAIVFDAKYLIIPALRFMVRSVGIAIHAFDLIISSTQPIVAHKIEPGSPFTTICYVISTHLICIITPGYPLRVHPTSLYIFISPTIIDYQFQFFLDHIILTTFTVPFSSAIH